ncbi:MAG: hypothetical protein IPK52_11220 [Chloroflexi bacterium]|nr:hypothetical protein [Chloroflexota bacterium]
MVASLQIQFRTRNFRLVVASAFLLLVLVAFTSSQNPPCSAMVVSSDDPSALIACFDSTAEVIEWATNGELVIPPGASETEIHELYNAYFALKNGSVLPLPID